MRVENDSRNEKLNFKIREAQVAKIPYMLIVGDKEMESGAVTVRLRNGKNLEPMTPARLCRVGAPGVPQKSTESCRFIVNFRKYAFPLLTGRWDAE